jgi:membrane associated rhomboid family serine protease
MFRNPFANLPAVTKNILILNIILFLGTEFYYMTKGIHLSYFLGEHYPLSSAWRVWQPITCMFMHGGIAHLVLNMFGLYMFGSVLERYWGPKKFLVFYMVCGLGGTITDFAVQYTRVESKFRAVNEYIENPGEEKLVSLIKSGEVVIYSKVPGMQEEFRSMTETYDALKAKGQDKEADQVSVNYFKSTYKPIIRDLNDRISIGASGAIFGLLLAFGMIFPNVELMFLFIPYPIKAKFVVIIYGCIELFSGLAQFKGDNIGHFAHLGGMLFGFVLLWYWKNRDKRIYH